MPILSGTILLVEDTPINQEVASTMLDILGCRVAIAQDGSEALHLLKTERFDVVLMDCQMPIVDGFAATAELRRRKHEGILRRMPVIALTAEAMEGGRERCLAAGMDD